MKINCICCGHRFEMDDSYDDYHGLVKCSVCRSLLQITTEGGKIKAVEMPAPGGGQVTSVAEAFAKHHVG